MNKRRSIGTVHYKPTNLILIPILIVFFILYSLHQLNCHHRRAKKLDVCKNRWLKKFNKWPTKRKSQI